jgi:hypothetical protein
MEGVEVGDADEEDPIEDGLSLAANIYQWSPSSAICFHYLHTHYICIQWDHITICCTLTYIHDIHNIIHN